ncbi:MAG: hypothetical protein M1818_007767 [Claussenomyces sp. TS43310]|nr:MAG: hypothetical protein M1818_007767 [Claussenomyces sp. TS43310]
MSKAIKAFGEALFTEKIYLQVNSQAKNGALKKFRKEIGMHANLAVGSINESESPEDQERAARELWTNLASQAKDDLQ